jgi:peptidoglycan hydrolase CwlO-like protein
MKDHNIVKALEADVEELYAKCLQSYEKIIQLEKTLKGVNEKLTKQQETIDLLSERTSFLLNR